MPDQVLPRPTLGQSLRFYPNGNIDEHRVEVGVVIKIGQSTVTLAMPGTNHVRSTVRYKDDPRLQKSPDQRQNGCWDFTEEWYERMEAEQYGLDTMARLDEEVRKLVDLMDLKDFYATPQSAANRVKAIEFGELRRHARELGVTEVLRKTAAQLHEAIARKEELLIQAQEKLESEKNSRRNETPAVSEDEARKEMLARALCNGDAARLAARMETEQVARKPAGGDNPKAPATGSKKKAPDPVAVGGDTSTSEL